MPAQEWQRALSEQIEKVRQLQNGYEKDLIDKQVTNFSAASCLIYSEDNCPINY